MLIYISLKILFYFRNKLSINCKLLIIYDYYNEFGNEIEIRFSNKHSLSRFIKPNKEFLLNSKNI
jgi:hypothetical protein